MDERRKYALLFAATILVARKLHEIGSKPCPAREFAIAEAIEKADSTPTRLRHADLFSKIKKTESPPRGGQATVVEGV